MRRGFFRSISIIAVLAVVAGAARASSRRRRVKDAQSSFEPRSRPGAGQKYLESFVGDWEVVKVFHPRAGEPVRTPGTCRQTMIHDGRFLQSEFVFDQGGRKSTGLGLIGLRHSDRPVHQRLDGLPPDADVVAAEPRAVRRQGDRPVQPIPR